MNKSILLICLLLGIILTIFYPRSKDATTNSETGKSVPIRNQVDHLSKDAESLLNDNGFVVVPTKAYKDMSHVYMTFHTANLPIFVTTDSILHTTHILFDQLLKIIEFDHLLNDLKELTRFMLEASINDYQTIENNKVRKAVYANITFFLLQPVYYKRLLFLRM